MLPESCPLICARCHVRLKGFGDPNDNATVFCPECGESDTHLGGHVLSEKALVRPVGGGGVVNGWGM
jgi:hypothetical protein